MSDDESIQEALAKVKRLEHFHLGRVGFWWAINVPIVISIFVVDQALWTKISVLYLVLVSLYANGATDLGNWQGARAERRSLENPPADAGD